MPTVKYSFIKNSIENNHRKGHSSNEGRILLKSVSKLEYRKLQLT